ncbi:hypothetical protein [Flavobacterium suncheonense]|uniref:Lipoprotein n=1 Tax=Flavobacterium suncheonense GH29-5 = DSM 17707 TaxID=1121899 RepID=A0A0A2MN92_9FLAO|nr:hypothetical protein [Flavobacterium suncheonense]KGO89740.1 hypothetical protein Q764_05985 [Flavobacterium suncheonense GH29-5 = DSM 17707]
MKAKLFFSCLLFSLLLAVGCTSSKPVVVETKTEVTKTVTETVHDTVFQIEKDSSSYKALIECVNGKPKIKEVIQSYAGKNLKPPKVNLKGNYIEIDCETRAQKLFAQWKSKYIKELHTTQTPVVIYKLTNCQQLQIYCFRFMILALLVYLGYNLIKYYFKR